MRILWQFKDYRTPMYDWVKFQIFDDLCNHGIQVELFDVLSYVTPTEANEALVKKVKESKYDVFVTGFNENDIFPETVKEIKRQGLATLLFCFDNLVVPYEHLHIAKYFDLVWLTAKETKWMFDQRECNTIFLPYAANPRLGEVNDREVRGVGFVGTPYGSRANLLNVLSENEVDVFCHCGKNPLKQTDYREYHYSNGVKTSILTTFFKMIQFPEGRKIIAGAIKNKLTPKSDINKQSLFYHEEVAVQPWDVYQLYSRYYLALSSTTARNTGALKHPLFIVNLRSFEIPMAGGIQFCRYNPELAEYFEEGREIIFFYNDKDMVDKAKFYMNDNHAKDRAIIRKAAKTRAIADHSWYSRFKKAFERLGLFI